MIIPRYNEFTLYTDGACRGNQFKENIGAWGYYMSYRQYEKEDSGIVLNTTNNKMELLSIIMGLKAIKNHDKPLKIITDSAYCSNGINLWMIGWMMRGWKTKRDEPIKNKELWIELYDIFKKFKSIEVLHCKGHDITAGNIKVDELCNKAMDEYIADTGYILGESKNIKKSPKWAKYGNSWRKRY